MDDPSRGDTPDPGRRFGAGVLLVPVALGLVGQVKPPPSVAYLCEGPVFCILDPWPIPGAPQPADLPSNTTVVSSAGTTDGSLSGTLDVTLDSATLTAFADVGPPRS